MSKLLKVIVNTLLLLAILSAGALVIPPFAGITTLVSDGMGNTNISRGAVTYAKKTDMSSVAEGDKILVDDNAGKYIYTIQSMDASAGTASVKNAISGDNAELTVKATVNKVIVTIPFIGFLSMAAQSKEGILIIGLAILFLIILFILSEVWKRDEEDEEDEEDDDEEDDEEENERGGLKDGEKEEQEKKRKQEEQDMAEELETAEQKTAETAEPVSLAETEEEQEEFKIRDLEEEKSDPVSFSTIDLQRLVRGEEAKPEPETEELTEESEFSETEKVSEETEVFTEEKMPEETETFETAAETEKTSDEAEKTEPAEEPEKDEEITEEACETTVQEEPEEIDEPEEEPDSAEPIELAMPVYTAEELLQKAHAAGDDPKVIEDSTTGVTILDYSDIL